jgi:hypothetical protein
MEISIDLFECLLTVVLGIVGIITILIYNNYYPLHNSVETNIIIYIVIYVTIRFNKMFKRIED